MFVRSAASERVEVDNGPQGTFLFSTAMRSVVPFRSFTKDPQSRPSFDGYVGLWQI